MVEIQTKERIFNIQFFLLGQFFLGTCMILYALDCDYIFVETFFAVAIVIIGAFFVKRKTVTYFIWTGWYLFLDVLQYGECYVHAENYAKKNTYMNYYLNLSVLRDDSMRKVFFLYSTVFYIVIIAVICVMEKTDNIEFPNKIAEAEQKWEIYLNPIVWLGIAVTIQFVYLKLSGKGIIPANGVIYYAFESILFFLAIMCLKQLLKKDESVLKTASKVIFVAILKSLPRLLSGSKSATIFAVLIFGMTVYMYNPKRFRRVLNFKILFWAVLAAFFAFEVSYRLKFGYWLASPDYIVRRFTGYNDGMAFLNYYLRYGNQYFPGGLAQWVNCVMGIGNEVSVNYFYTHNILGYSLSGVTAAGLPAFCSGLLYGNSVGLIITAGLIAFVMSALERGMHRSKQLEYVAVRVLIYINMVHMLIDGAMDNIKAVAVAAGGCLLIIFLTKILHISFVSREEN